MTIAISVVVHPSRSLLLSVYTIAFMALTAAVLILFIPCELSPTIRLQISAIASISTGVAVFKAGRPGKTFHIDISGIGQIRLTQYSGVSAFNENARLALDGNSGLVVHLAPDSVLWPHFLLLRLKLEQGAVVSIPVLPESISGPGFSELSVACRYLSLRKAAGETID